MTGFYTISVHVWHPLKLPALKGREAGEFRPRIYRENDKRQLF